MLSDKRHEREEDGLNSYRAFANKVRRNRERTNLYGGIGYILHPSIDEANLIFYLKKEENTFSSKISNDFSNCEESSLIF